MLGGQDQDSTDGTQRLLAREGADRPDRARDDRLRRHRVPHGRRQLHDASRPTARSTGDTFLGVEGNGWTNVLWAGGGLLLVLGAPMHWGAKTMALIVGLVLGAAAIIAVYDGGDVFGIFAANDMTMLAVGRRRAIALLLLALLPRVGGQRREVVDDDRTVAPERRARRSSARRTSAAAATPSASTDEHAHVGRFDRDRRRSVAAEERDERRRPTRRAPLSAPASGGPRRRS